MIRWISSSQIAGGKSVELVQWVADFLKFLKKYKGLPTVKAFTNIVGDGGVITFSVDYKDFSELDKAFKQISVDPEYAKKIDDASDLFIQGSNKVTIMNEI